LDAKEWLAIAGLLFGVVQFGITIIYQRRAARLQEALMAEARFRVKPDFLYFNSEAFDRLLARLERGTGSGTHDPKTLLVSVVQLRADTPWTADPRPAGWEAFRQIHALSLKDQSYARDQVYRFLRLTNYGERDVDEVHVAFSSGDSVVVGNIRPGSAIRLPVSVNGRHADIARLKVRSPERVWYVYRWLGVAKPVEVPLLQTGEQQSTDLPGAWQALPEFGRRN
jgi:hypothetical protein